MPSVQNGVLEPSGGGAVCDDFLTAKPQTLSEPAWEAQELADENAGDAVECTTANSLGNLKQELELLCSNTPCSYQTQAAIKVVTEALGKSATLRDRARALAGLTAEPLKP